MVAALRLWEGVWPLQLRLHEETVIEGMAVPVADACQQVEVAGRGWAEDLTERRITAAMRVGRYPRDGGHDEGQRRAGLRLNDDRSAPLHQMEIPEGRG